MRLTLPAKLLFPFLNQSKIPWISRSPSYSAGFYLVTSVCLKYQKMNLAEILLWRPCDASSRLTLVEDFVLEVVACELVLEGRSHLLLNFLLVMSLKILIRKMLFFGWMSRCSTHFEVSKGFRATV